MKNVLEETKFIMDKYGIRANKSLGQNFIKDGNIIYHYSGENKSGRRSEEQHMHDYAG